MPLQKPITAGGGMIKGVYDTDDDTHVNTAEALNDGSGNTASIADVNNNTTHRGSDGNNHSNVVTNNGKISYTDAAAVSSNTAHKTSDGSAHTFLDQDVTTGSSPTFDATNITGTVTGTVEVLHLDVRKGSVGTIAARTPVYISGFNPSGFIEVEEADADVVANMPAIGISNVEITNAATVKIVNGGELTGIATNDGGWAVNDSIYIAGGGGLTKTKPTGTTMIQKVAEIARVHASQGVLVIVGAGRSNDLPNIPSNNIWLGDGSAVPTETDFDTEVSANSDVTTNSSKISGGLNRIRSITIEGPTASEDLSVFFTPVALTISEMRAVLIGSSTPSVTWTIRHHATDRSNAGIEVVTGGTTTTSTTAGSDVTSFNDETIPADSFVWIETTAQSGIVNELSVSLIFDYD